MRHGHASLGLQARTGVEARVRRLGQGWGARVSSQRETVLLDLLVSVLTYYLRHVNGDECGHSVGRSTHKIC